MKKLFNGKFLVIVASSIVMLILLIVGAFSLFNKDEDKFVKSGYIINPLSEKTERYFFDEDTGYHVNLSQMVEFTDVDKKDVTVLKDSFLHYTDGSLSFLKNGAILDLDSVKGDKAVVFYNITSKSIIDKTGDGYVISNQGNDIKINNFIGRINDDKYIVVGKLNAKIPGNTANIQGDYFEIVYTTNGVVNIENKDVKYQVAAEGTMIYVGDLVIDLGNKKITRLDEDVMSITAITIDGDENIEIIPKEDKEEDNKGNDGNGQGDGNQGNGGIDNPDNQGDDNQGDGSQDGNREPEVTDEMVVSLKDVSIGSTNIDVIFDILNKKDDEILRLHVVNVDSGRTVDNTIAVNDNELIRVNLLSPKTKYLLAVVSEKNGTKYFQKMFETNDFGVKLEKAYATDSSLGFKVSILENTDIKSAKLSLYKFNEETGKNEIVKIGYYDEASDTTIYKDRVISITDLEGNIEGVHEVLFDGLDSNSIYTAVLDQFSLESANFKDIYNLTLTTMTLKKTPSFNEMVALKDVGKGSFKLSLDNIVDDDSAITSYTYLIYEKNKTDKTAINPIVNTSAAPIEVRVGAGKNELKNDTNYFYKVIIEYFDNEKYIEYITSDSINFVMGSDPIVTVVPDNTKISYDRVGGTIYLTDNSCLVTLPDREGCAGTSSVLVEATEINNIGNTRVFPVACDFLVDGTEIKCDFSLDGLTAGTMYKISVKSSLNDREGIHELENSDTSKPNISTKTLSSFKAEWIDKGSSYKHVVNLALQLKGKSGTGTLTPEESAEALRKITLKIYPGNNIEDIYAMEPIGVKSFVNTEEFNLKENFYDNSYIITTEETFGLDIDTLKSLSSDGKLSEYYTIIVEAYYDDRATNRAIIDDDIHPYMISPELLKENVEDPTVRLEKITNKASGYMFENIQGDTVVGYIVHASFDRAGLVSNDLIPKDIKIYVYNENGQRVDFYIKDDSGNLVTVSNITSLLDESGFYDHEIYMTYGTDYEVEDTVMSRGNGYYIGYELTIDSAKGEIRYPSTSDNVTYSDYGVFEHVIADKENPRVQMYIARSTSDSITYNYAISDYDKALYKEYGSYAYYYRILGGSENKITLGENEDALKGEFTISSLSKNTYYELYYKKAVNKTSNKDEDVKPYVEGGERLFEGYYDGDSFRYEIINNPLSDNKVTIKVLTDKELLDRTTWYKVKLSDSLGNTLDREFGFLTKCSVDDTENRCYTIDYVELKNAGMKSDKNKINNIKVEMEAYYDNGIVGYDYCNGNDYVIIQNNSTKESIGDYLITAYSMKDGNKNFYLTKWNTDSDLARGYYTCKVRGNFIDYYNVPYDGEASFKITRLTSLGNDSNYGIINPKKISTKKMSTDNDSFSFSSITPAIRVSDNTKMLNGEVKNLTLSGIDLDDIQEENGEYYLYIETFGSLEDAQSGDNAKIVRPTLKVKIDKSNPLNTISAEIDKLRNGKTYYFNVYAYMYKGNKYVYTQLFDDKYKDSYQVESYKLTPISASEIYSKKEYSVINNPDAYGSKDFKFMITLKNYPYNFDITYIFCPINVNCDINGGYIYKKTIDSSNVKNISEDITNITEYDLEFNKNYVIKAYAVIDVYNDSMNIEKNNILLNNYDDSVKLIELATPSFVVTRKAKYEDGKYLIDLNINVVDKNETLKNGIYHIKLTNADGEVVGTLEQLGNDGTYVVVGNYDSYNFDAREINKSIRITDLNPNERYTLLIYGEAYVNNYSEVIPKEDREFSVSREYVIYTTNNYGVAFGKDVVASVAESSVALTFIGGSNFDKVEEINYTINLVDGVSSANTYSGTDIKGEGNKKFEIYAGTDNYSYVITPEGMKNENGAVFNIKVQFKVTAPDEPLGYVLLDVFEGKQQYRLDEE